jgi:hypothetical protein
MGIFIIAPALAIILYLCYTVAGVGIIVFVGFLFVLAIVGAIGLALDYKDGQDELDDLSRN